MSVIHDDIELTTDAVTDDRKNTEILSDSRYKGLTAAAIRLGKTEPWIRYHRAIWNAQSCGKCGSTIDRHARVTWATLSLTTLFGIGLQDAPHCDACTAHHQTNYDHGECEFCKRPVRLYMGTKYRIWCSDKCAQDFYNKRRPATTTITKCCTACGSRFSPRRSDAKFCSPACKQRAFRLHHVVVSNSRNAAQQIMGQLDELLERAKAEARKPFR